MWNRNARQPWSRRGGLSSPSRFIFPWLAFRWAINAKPTTSTLPLTNFISLLSMTFFFRVFCVRHYVWMECILISPVCETPSLDGERFDASSLWKIIFGYCAFIQRLLCVQRHLRIDCMYSDAPLVYIAIFSDGVCFILSFSFVKNATLGWSMF